MAVLQMTWQPSSLSHKRKSGPPLGLRNLGNTCYLNSVLQCLTYTPALANFCLKSQHSSSCDIGGAAASEKKRECPFCILERRIVRSLNSESNLEAPNKMNNYLKIFAEHFRQGRQEDAHEFLRYVIDACHNTCLRLQKLQQRRKAGESGNEGSIVKDIFGGALQSQVKCLSCGAESNKVDEIMDISLDVLHSSSLKDALQRFFQHEILDGNNKYKCDNCKKLVPARKQMSILQAPNVLVIQLKRFEGILGGKIDKAITFEEVLVLSSYMCKGSQDSCPEYRLCGTIVHSGFSPDSGHYFSYIKDAMGRWYCCNDSYVKLSNLEEVLSEKVYILFFTRSKQRPPVMKAGLLANGSKRHQSNGSDASKILNGSRTEKEVNSTKHLPDLHSETNNSIVSKAENVPSDPPRKLGIFESSSDRKNHANGGFKIIVHRKDSNPKSCNLTDVPYSGNRQNNVQGVSNGNGVSTVRADDTSDTKPPIANGISKYGNGHVMEMVYSAGETKLPSNHANSLDAKNKATSLQIMSNGNGVGDVKPSDDSGHVMEMVYGTGEKKMPNGHTMSLDAKNKQTSLHIVSNGNGVGDVKPGDSVDSANRRFPLNRANGDYQNQEHSGHSSDEDDGANVGEGNGDIGKPSHNKELSNGNVKCHSDSSSLKRKLKDRDPCILLAKDAQSVTEVENFKRALKKDASLVLVSCGWTDEVYKFMHSHKKLCFGEMGNDASKINDVKRVLVKDAGKRFNSKIPESLKRKLIESINSFSTEK